MQLPTTEFEQAAWKKGFLHVAGVDEVGRGCLAGPVVAGAVVFSPNHTPIERVRDSKLIARKERELLAEQIKEAAVSWAVGSVGVHVINRKGIVYATMEAMKKALRSLAGFDYILVDGPKAPKLKDFEAVTIPIVDGDALCYSIAAASIVAKVYRDSVMRQLAKSAPGYDWDHNVGYATPNHISGLKRTGVSKHHRLLFIRKVMNFSSI